MTREYEAAGREPAGQEWSDFGSDFRCWPFGRRRAAGRHTPRARNTNGSAPSSARGRSGSPCAGYLPPFPLNAVLWLVENLRKSGIRLNAGNVLSLGSFTPLLASRAGTTIRVRYLGLPGDPEVSVRFK